MEITDKDTAIKIYVSSGDIASDARNVMRQDKWDVFGRSIAQKMTLLFEGNLSAPYIRHVKNGT